MMIIKRDGLRRVLSTVLSFAAVCALSIQPALAGDFAGIVFFGDSLSDPGNHFEEFGMTSQKPFVQDPEYPYAIGGNHFSNGATWAEQFARRMKLPASGKPALREPGLFTNYAVGRARARAGAPTFPLFDLNTQVGLFLTDFDGQAPPDNLYAIWIGANDISDALQAYSVDPSGQLSVAILEQALAAVAGNVQALWMDGARSFLVPDQPNFAITPYFRDLGPVAQYLATELTTYYNSALAETLDFLSTQLPGTTFVRLDVNAVFAQIFSDPAAAGLTNVEDSCLTFGVIGKAICSTPNRYLFWDGVHPTRTGHGAVADAALEAVEQE